MKLGCLFVLGLFGGLFLRYDLSVWLPIIHRSFPGISDPGPISVFPWLFIAGMLFGGPALAVAIVTLFLRLLGIV